MTRQKKELIKRINEIREFIEADEELGCGFCPVKHPMERRLESLEDQLAKLSHYESAEEMDNDDRYMKALLARAM